MPYFFAIYEQGEGCDYTIECGTKVVPFHAVSFGEAQELVEEAFEGHESDQGLLPHNCCEGGLEGVQLIEVTRTSALDIRAMQKKIEDAAAAERDEQREEKERAEFERLSKKFRNK